MKRGFQYCILNFRQDYYAIYHVLTITEQHNVMYTQPAATNNLYDFIIIISCVKKIIYLIVAHAVTSTFSYVFTELNSISEINVAAANYVIYTLPLACTRVYKPHVHRFYFCLFYTKKIWVISNRDLCVFVGEIFKFSFIFVTFVTAYIFYVFFCLFFRQVSIHTNYIVKCTWI